MQPLPVSKQNSAPLLCFDFAEDNDLLAAGTELHGEDASIIYWHVPVFHSRLLLILYPQGLQEILPDQSMNIRQLIQMTLLA
jgi:hypothetical protein